MEGVDYSFDITTLTLDLTSDPSLLPKATVDLGPSRRSGVIYPHDNSAFLNYGLDYSAGGESLAFEGLTVSNELGVRIRDLLFLTDSTYFETPDDSQFVRLNTSLTWDDRDTLRRFVAGDIVAFSGNLGRRVQMGGLSLSKVYRIDPYFIRYPLFDFSGLVSLPSEVDLYVDGVRVRSERFTPGEFELRNYQGLGGAQTVEVVIRDSLGREQRIVSPFYFTDQLLGRGLHEYSYNLGLLRRDFGLTSSGYADLAFSGFHRYGISDHFNLGLRGEAGDGVLNLGLESAMTVGSLGLVRLEGAGSISDGQSGVAGFISYEYQDRRFRARFALQGFSERYRLLGEADSGTRRQYNLLAGVGFSSIRFGSFGLDITRTADYDEADRQVITLSWTRRLWRRIYANANLRQVRAPQTSYEFGLNLSWYFGDDTSLSGSVRRENGENIQVVEARKTIPLGQGTGWSIRGERSGQAAGVNSLLNASAQHNARHAVLRGDFSLGSSEDLSTEDLRLAVSGALVHIGDNFALTRPVNDSFALVSVGDAEGVGVYINGQSSGHTDHRGQLIVPELSSYYDNQISIEDQDIPLDYLMPKVRLFLSPPLRSGSCINFPLQTYQAFTGTLTLPGDGGAEPLAFAEVSLAAPEGKVNFWTGGEGEFYFDSQQAEFDLTNSQGCAALQETNGDFLPPGRYPLTVRQENLTFLSELVIPEVGDQVVDLGVILLPFKASGPLAPGSTQHKQSNDGLASPPAAEVKSEIITAPEVKSAPSERTPAVLAPPVPNKAAAVKELVSPAHASAAARVENESLIPSETVIHFPFDRATPLSADMKLLVSTMAYLLNHPETRVAIEGHTSREGNGTYNDRLGGYRAQAIQKYLLMAGIAPERITQVCSLGEHRPVCLDASEQCRRQNRRAVLILVKT